MLTIFNPYISANLLANVFFPDLAGPLITILKFLGSEGGLLRYLVGDLTNNY